MVFFFGANNLFVVVSLDVFFITAFAVQCSVTLQSSSYFVSIPLVALNVGVVSV